jgi:sorbitol-specific phosphotransferase system component IIC
MVETTSVNVEHQVVGLFTKAHAIQVSAFLEQAIAQGVSVFGLPVGALPRVWMLGVNEVKPLRKEMQKCIWFLDPPGN